MNEDDESEKVIDLLMRAQEPDAPADVRRELNELLRTEAPARKLAARHLADEASLVLSLRSENIAHILNDEVADLSVVGTMDRPRFRTASEVALRWAVGIAAAFAVLAGTLFMKLNQSDPAIMTVTDLNGSLRFTGDGGRVMENLKEGQLLGGGTLETLTSDSTASLVFMDGSRVTLEGQSTMTIADFGQKELRLRRGDFSAKVNPQPQGKPMLVHTPTAKAEVLGTQFNMRAGSLKTALTVNEGRVRMTRLADGSEQEVTANHQVVASLDRRDRFKATPRPEQVNSWHSTLPWDKAYGEWLPGKNGQPSALAAEPMLWKPKPGEQHVLQIAALKVAAGDTPPTVLKAGTRFRVLGRAKTGGKIYIGFSTHHRKGGFAGKYVAETAITTEPGERFELDLPIETFRPEETKFPSSPLGMEMMHWWAVSFDQNSGLQIIEAELGVAAPEQPVDGTALPTPAA